MASVLILSERGRILPLGGRLKNEGHIVKVWLKRGAEEVLKGGRNPSRVQMFSLLEQYDLILMEPTLMEEYDKIKGCGKPILGCNGVMGKIFIDTQYHDKVRGYLYGQKPDLEGLGVRLMGWMTSEGASPVLGICFPSLRMMDGDRGVKTEGMGSLVLALKEGDQLLKLLHPFDEFLLKSQYIGPFTIEAKVKGDLWIVNQIHSFFLCEDVLALSELLKTSLFEFLFDLQEGGKNGKVWDGLGIGVTVSIPPWPHMGVPTLGDYISVPEPARKHFSMGDAHLGVLGVASSRGADVREVRRRVYRTINNSVTSQECQFRSDIGMMAEDDMITLREWGWLQ